MSRLNPLRGLAWLWVTLGNLWRRRVRRFDYILLTVPRSMPALPEERGFLRRRFQGEAPLSLFELEKHFTRIGGDPRPGGIILHLRGFDMPLADLQTLRDSISRLRQRGKKVICYAHSYTLPMYYVASVADEILLLPGGELMTTGLRQEAHFLKDALAAIGVEFEAVAISPYKSALDPLSRSDISPEGRQQLEWLLESRFDMIVQGIAAGRGMSREAVLRLIDDSPLMDTAALQAGYVDAVLNEEALPAHLGIQHIVPWERAVKVLLRRWRKWSAKHVALLYVSGTIIDGKSGKPPVELPVPILGDTRAGDLTVVRQVRQISKNPQAGAVVLFVDSRGGSASASEAMASALEELARSRPLVAFMGSVAASGGYYIATPAHYIVAQPGTITGSIGVLMGKAVTRGLFDRLRINRLEFTRGANAAIFAGGARFTDEQRAVVRRSIDRIYELFVERVARSRSMSAAAVDAVGGGRVWTGAQARTHGLVDELGDLQTALAKARALAGLGEDAPVALFTGRDEPVPPQVTDAPAAVLRYLAEGVQAISGAAQLLMPVDVR